MSEQKMREALTYIEGLAAADDARDLPTIAATAQEALAQPDDVGLTDEEIESALNDWRKHRVNLHEAIRMCIAAHEAKKGEPS